MGDTPGVDDARDWQGVVVLRDLNIWNLYDLPYYTHSISGCAIRLGGATQLTSSGSRLRPTYFGLFVVLLPLLTGIKLWVQFPLGIFSESTHTAVRSDYLAEGSTSVCLECLPASG